MEFFNKAKAVRLRSYHSKYLIADEDEETVRQSHNGSSHRARWTVDFVQNNSHLIRLKSYYNKYLAASDEPFLLGTAGKKVMQTPLSWEKNICIEWEPMTSGLQVRLRTREGKFLRANGGTPPWRNSVTHDVPYRTLTQDWVLWDVDVVDILDFESLSNCVSLDCVLSKSSNSYVDDFTESDTTSPAASSWVGHSFATQQSGMEVFQKAKVVRLRSHHDKYLLAEDDQESVCQDRNGSVRNAKWTVEVVQNAGVLRFQSCYGKYLSASNMPLFLGVTGKKVVQTLPRRLDSSLEWEPIREGIQVKLKTRYGHYLRANGGVPPWRNSITHDIPHRTSTQDWILWDVDIVEFQKPTPIASPTSIPSDPAPLTARRPLRTTTPAPSRMSVPAKTGATQPIKMAEKLPSESTSPTSFHLKNDEVDGSFTASAGAKGEGRLIVYEMMDDKGNVDKSKGELSFTFKGSGVEQLKQMVKEVTGLNDIIVCSRNPLNGKLYPLRLHLPPNNATMHVVVVPSTSPLARDIK